jgi:hypothetical protein
MSAGLRFSVFAKSSCCPWPSRFATAEKSPCLDRPRMSARYTAAQRKQSFNCIHPWTKEGKELQK